MKRMFAILAAATLVILLTFVFAKVIVGTIVTLVTLAGLAWELRRFLRTDQEEDRIAGPFELDKT